MLFLCRKYYISCRNETRNVVSFSVSLWRKQAFYLKANRGKWLRWSYIQVLSVPCWGSGLRCPCLLVWGSSAARPADPPAESWPSLCRWCRLPEGYSWFAPPALEQWPQRSPQLLAAEMKKENSFQFTRSSWRTRFCTKWAEIQTGYMGLQGLLENKYRSCKTNSVWPKLFANW